MINNNRLWELSEAIYEKNNGAVNNFIKQICDNIEEKLNSGQFDVKKLTRNLNEIKIYSNSNLYEKITGNSFSDFPSKDKKLILNGVMEKFDQYYVLESFHIEYLLDYHKFKITITVKNPNL